jgi:hypothetical protein
MTIIPDTADVRKFLTLKWRMMEKSRGQTQIVKMTSPLYTPVTIQGTPALSCFHGFWKSLKEHLEAHGHEVVVVYRSLHKLPTPNLTAAKAGLRPWQLKWITRALVNGNSGLIGAPTRYGKCLSPLTNVRMLDGSLKAARDIEAGDRLLGPDGMQRTVASICSGRDLMYRIQPDEGGAWECTQDHILSLFHAPTGDIRHMRVDEFVALPPSQQSDFAQYRVGPRDGTSTICGLTGITAFAIGEGDYAGFTLEEQSDARFLLEDYTVTHNSYGMTAICNAYPGQRTVITAPGVSLCRQLLQHFQEHLPKRDVRGVFTGSRAKTQGPDITVCSIDSLHLMDPDDTDLLIIDEPHAVVSDTRLPKLVPFAKARKYGFGATLDGRFDGKDRLIEGFVGPIISNVTYREAVADGAISPLKVLMYRIPFSKDTLPGNPNRDTVYRRLLTQSTRTAALIRKLLHEVIPQDWQTMAFIVDEKQAQFYMREAFPTHGTIAMAKLMTGKERDSVTDRIASGELVRVLASNIYVQGITFPDLKVVINLANGGANTTAIQKPGRLLQARPGKNYGVLIDLLFECRDADSDMRARKPYAGFVGECWARLNKYKEVGYDVQIVESASDVKQVLDGAYAFT